MPDGFRDVFELSLQLPADAAGSTLTFPTIQECAEGSTEWTQIPDDGQDPEELEHPAPSIAVIESEAEEGAQSHDHEADADSDARSDALQVRLQQRLLRGAGYTTVTGKGDAGLPLPLPIGRRNLAPNCRERLLNSKGWVNWPPSPPEPML